jgi:hypothetical protein
VVNFPAPGSVKGASICLRWSYNLLKLVEHGLEINGITDQVALSILWVFHLSAVLPLAGCT